MTKALYSNPQIAGLVSNKGFKALMEYLARRHASLYALADDSAHNKSGRIIAIEQRKVIDDVFKFLLNYKEQE